MCVSRAVSMTSYCLLVVSVKRVKKSSRKMSVSYKRQSGQLVKKTSGEPSLSVRGGVNEKSIFHVSFILLMSLKINVSCYMKFVAGIPEQNDEIFTLINSFILQLDLILQASCKNKLHLPLLKVAFFKGGLGGGGGGGSAKMELNS